MRLHDERAAPLWYMYAATRVERDAPTALHLPKAPLYRLEGKFWIYKSRRLIPIMHAIHPLCSTAVATLYYTARYLLGTILT